MAQLRVYTFGPPRLERDGQSIDLGLRKALALIVYLAITGQPHSRDHLATLLWPESDQREGRGRIRRMLHRVSEALGADVLNTDGDTVRIRADFDLWLDCSAFHAEATAGLSASPVPVPPRLAHLTTAVQLYTAEFLAGFTLPDSPAFDEWQFFQRENLRQLYGQVLEQLVQAYCVEQAWEQAIAYARRWLALDPLHEPAHRTLMHLYAWAGQQAAAIRQYAECTRILDAELGVVPEDETAALYEAIRTRQFGTAAPTPVSVVPAPAPRTPRAEHATAPTPAIRQRASHPNQLSLPEVEEARFVARQRELCWLDGMLDAALEGQHRVAFVLGEAGQGKTALLQAFARRAQQAHGRLVVVGGNCNAYTGVGDPYLPFREMLELLTGDVEARTAAGTLSYDQADRLWHTLTATTQALLEVGRDLLGTFIPTRPLLDRAVTAAPQGAAWLTQLQALAISKAIPTDQSVQQQDLFEQYARVVQDVARRVPLVLLLDDIQWADRGSLDLLFHLGRRLAGSRVLIIAAYRPSEVALGRDGERHPLERVVNECRRDFGDITVDLTEAEGYALVEELIDSEPNQLNTAFRSTLFRQTEGHPLFTIELLRGMQERGNLVRDAEERWVEQGNLDWTTVPARVEGAISERVNRLDPALQELLQIASVEGEEFTAELVAQVLGIDEREVVHRLSRDVDKTHRLVHAVGIKHEGSLRLSRYRFGHILVQQYIYNRLDVAEQIYFNEALGQALEHLYGDQPERVAAQLARHFAAAHLPERAAVYLQHAGDQARRSAALAEAVHSYQTALDAWPLSNLSGRAALLRKLGECLWLQGQLHDALAPLEACYALYESLGDYEGAGAIQRLLGRLCWEQGARQRSLQHYYRALELLEQGPESVELAWAISSISQMHMLASENEQAITWGQRALVMAERLGAEQVAVHALANIGSACFGSGDAERGTALLRRSWQRAVELDLPYDASRAANNLGVSLVYYGLLAEARDVFEDFRTYAVRMQMHLNTGLALLSLTKLDWMSGRWQRAMTRREELVAWISQGQSNGYLKVLTDTMFAWMHNDLGQAGAAHDMLEQAQPLVADRAEIHTTGPYLSQQVRTFGLLKHEDTATTAARQFLQLSGQQVYWDALLSHLIVCRWFADHMPEMRAELRAILAQIERADTQFHSPATAAALSEARGLVARSEGDLPQARDYLQQAVAHWRAMGRPYDQARALHDLGHFYIQGGDVDGARTTFDEAQSLIDTLAAQLVDPDVKAAFLDSPLVHAIRAVRASEPHHDHRTRHASAHHRRL